MIKVQNSNASDHADCGMLTAEKWPLLLIQIHSTLAWDVNETLAYETETRPKHSIFGPRRDWDQDLPAIPRDLDKTETSDFCHETRPRLRPCKAETKMFFETFSLQHCAKTMNGEPASVDVTNSLVTETVTAMFMHYHEIYSPHKH